MAKHSGWLPFKGTRGVRWWYESPIGRAAMCEGTVCHGVTRRVEKDEPRLEVDNGKGRGRESGRGKKNQWVCQYCARHNGVQDDPNDNQQQELF